MSKQKLLDFGEEDNNFGAFKVNEQFKSKYEYNERRKHLEQGRLKYGDLLEGDQESEESSSSDDSDAELVNEKFEKKFLDVITKIRNGDKSIKET